MIQIDNSIHTQGPVDGSLYATVSKRANKTPVTLPYQPIQPKNRPQPNDTTDSGLHTISIDSGISTTSQHSFHKTAQEIRNDYSTPMKVEIEVHGNPGGPKSPVPKRIPPEEQAQLDALLRDILDVEPAYDKPAAGVSHPISRPNVQTQPVRTYQHPNSHSKSATLSTASPTTSTKSFVPMTISSGKPILSNGHHYHPKPNVSNKASSLSPAEEAQLDGLVNDLIQLADTLPGSSMFSLQRTNSSPQPFPRTASNIVTSTPKSLKYLVSSAPTSPIPSEPIYVFKKPPSKFPVNQSRPFTYGVPANSPVLQRRRIHSEKTAYTAENEPVKIDGIVKFESRRMPKYDTYEETLSDQQDEVFRCCSSSSYSDDMLVNEDGTPLTWLQRQQLKLRCKHGKMNDDVYRRQQQLINELKSLSPRRPYYARTCVNWTLYNLDTCEFWTLAKYPS